MILAIICTITVILLFIRLFLGRANRSEPEPIDSGDYYRMQMAMLCMESDQMLSGHIREDGWLVVSGEDGKEFARVAPPNQKGGRR